MTPLWPLPSSPPEREPDVLPRINRCGKCNSRDDLTVTLQHGFRCRSCGHPPDAEWTARYEGREA